MNIKNFLINWVFPKGYIGLYQKINKKTKADIFPQALFKPNEKFRNIHKGKRCFILASGPSIKNQDLSPIYGEICIAVSHFHLHDDIKKINPKYHVLAPQHYPFNFSDSSKYFNDFKESYKNINPNIFLGLTNYEFNYLNLLKKHPELKVPNIHYLNYSEFISLSEENHLNEKIWDISENLFIQRTVIYGALQISIYMGFSEIYLIGVDHDYLNDITRTTNHHFYAEEKGISDKTHLDQFDLEYWFLEYHLRWKQFRLIENYCKEKQIKIYNATEGGMLDVFERKNLKSIFK